MKRFTRTIAGKTFLFIMCIISVCTLILSGVLAWGMVQEDFYTKSKEKVYEDIVEGRLASDIYDIFVDLDEERNEGVGNVSDRGNLIYRIKDEPGTIIVASESSSKVKNWQFSYLYHVTRNPEGEIFNIYPAAYSPATEEDAPELYLIDISISEDKGIIDYYSFFRNVFNPIYELRYGVYLIAVLSLLAFIAAFVALMSVSGKVNDSEELHPGPLNAIPFDVLCVAAASLIAMYFAGFLSMRAGTMFEAAAGMIGLLIGGCTLLGLCMSMACRIKQKTLISKSFCWWTIRKCLDLICWCWNLLKKSHAAALSLLRQLPLVWKSAAAFLIVMFIEGMVLANSYSDNYVAFWLVKNMILFPAILYLVLCMRRLQKGAEALSTGDLSYQIDTKHMYYDLKEHGENLNSIAKGMTLAVNKQMKSERMKTELITNVSHDIKTPLTSIINYADLIGKEETDNPKIEEYTEVLLRQSERLKRLIDDLVEASKASTGNLEVNLTPCECSTFVEQASGEYEDKLKQAKLHLITSLPEEELFIMADGRRMWRIFDNLMNNICKYALQDTRVYLSLDKEGDNAVFTFKNTSRDQLNISEDELMERFTRGDQSRNTEGNGLGLSIARSMAELQGGKLELSIDGDLFKAILSFPLIDRQ